MGNLQSLSDCYRDALLRDCIGFWFPRCVDQEYGGFIHSLDRDGTSVDDDKSVWVQGRMAWMLLELFNDVERNPDWLAWAEGALGFLQRHGFDQDGRMFFHLTRQGQPIRKRRYAYSESFAAIAFAAHFLATQEDSSKDLSRRLFMQFVDWNFTAGKMPPKFTNTRPMLSLGPRMITVVTAQELRRALGPDPLFEEWIDRCIEEIERWFVKPEFECVMENVGVGGAIVDHFDGRILNPGHAIEAAWIVMREGQIRARHAWIDLGTKMLRWTLARGWDREFGGIYYFRDVYERPVQEYWHDMKFWWPHNEALIATLLAWTLTGDSRDFDWHQRIHDWSWKHFFDPEHGEWFGYLHRDGRLSTTLKGNLWKSFFHHPRCLLYCWRMCEGEPIP